MGKRWTDSGETHDDRGLKNRPMEGVRPVPILRDHIDTFGVADDGRLLANERRGSGRLVDVLPRPAGSPRARAPAGRFRLAAHRLCVRRRSPTESSKSCYASTSDPTRAALGFRPLDPSGVLRRSRG